MGQAVGGDAMALAIPDRRIVDHGAEMTQGIDLGRDILGAGDGFDVADHNRLRLGQRAPGVLRTVGVAGMKDDLMTLAREEFACH
jgi:hypothetical protein